MRLWEPVVGQPRHAVPRATIFLTAPPKRASPKVDYRVPERAKRPAVCRNREVG